MSSQKYNFEAKTSEILELLTHSVYSDKEVFLRELISNASDAIDKARIKSLTDTDYLGDDTEFRVRIGYDEKVGTITIDDNGIGMTEKEVKENIGTIAHSGTKKFIEKLKKSDESHLIGQFGIGFYSAFIVADEVTIDTKTSKGKAVKWSSKGKGEYEIDAGERKSRGTSITLTLKKDEKEFASEWKLSSIIRKHSNYVPVVIELPETDDKGKKKVDAWKQINETKAIWTRSKSEVKDEEYKEFYTSLSYDSGDPLAHLHLNIEGVTSFKSLLFIPKDKPFQVVRPDEDYGPKLYSNKVLILENSKELLPVWLRFVRGVVETSDLSLNVSREMLQNDTTLEKIQKNLIKKILGELGKKLSNDRENYETFFTHFGETLKEGIHYDWDNKQDIAKVCLFYSLNESAYITLDEYLEKKQKDQKDIYYLTGSDRAQLASSPYIEKLKASGHDVLLLSDPIDEWVAQGLSEYGEAKLVSASSADLDLADKKESKEEQKKSEQTKKDMKDFLLRLKTILGKESIEKVEVTDRLVDSPAVLTVEKGGMTPQMEAMMQSMGQAVPPSKKSLELNPDHGLVQAMKKEFDSDPKSEKLETMTHYLRDQSILAEGGQIDDMNAFVTRMNEIAGKYLG